MRNRRKEGVFLIRIFKGISARWNLTADEQLELLNVKSMRVFRDFEKGRKIPPEELFRRVGYLLSISRTLDILLPDAYAADNWIRRPNSARIFGGRPALNLMLSGEEGIRTVRDYLLAECT